eukprot:CAMPEP_0195509482 /NCGR_PEP_ID=MMETSP0794_2-20130614/2407_1 /TAXON_ID=515487 /ORGANISM="Stephanopyxis turris, Strain CCMP 815" /LENGTH=117 /DNA_ID=CAMNT_0040636713 /DNA_START=242 /DNA_END=595 /DNA_ORIENTATION=-
MTDDYGERALRYGLASKEEIKDVLASDSRTVFVDVRSPPEILESSLKTRPYISAWCTMNDSSRLTELAPQLLPDKKIPIVVFCAIGGRSAGAQRALEALGYEKVLNGGGLKDLDYVV